MFILDDLSKDMVVKLVNGIDEPINILLNNKFHDFAELEKIGVQRISIRFAPVRYIYSRTIKIADCLRVGGVADILEHNFN